MSNTLSSLQVLVSEELGFTCDPASLDPQASLFEGGLNVDSIAIVELIVKIEEQFGVRFEDFDLVPETFATLGALADKIESMSSIESDQSDAIAG